MRLISLFGGFALHVLAVSAPPTAMVWVPGGEATMGTDEKEAYPVEHPAHRVTIDGFWMDETEVTNAQFASFVEATNYITIAERVPDWEELKKQLPPGTQKPSAEKLVPGSLVFTPPKEKPTRDDATLWWKWTPGANWRHPEGPRSSIQGREAHPVVQVAWEDAFAYAKWAGKRLPTEAEWEFAARGGLDGKRYAWGDQFRPEGRLMANVWQGQFPGENTREDGFERSAPAKSFPPNGYGLYDMIGNAWEWCADWFDASQHAKLASEGLCHNPRGPARSFSPHAPHSQQRVTKGGSFLCAENYCVNYRPSSRRGTDFDTGMSHLGFRCVRSPDQRVQTYWQKPEIPVRTLPSIAAGPPASLPSPAPSTWQGSSGHSPASLTNQKLSHPPGKFRTTQKSNNQKTENATSTH